MSNSPGKRIANSEEPLVGGPHVPFDVRYSLCLFSSSLLASSFAAPSRGACGAPVALRMPATHPDRPAMTGGQTPHRSASPSRARLAFVAHHRMPVAAFDMPHVWASKP